MHKTSTVELEKELQALDKRLSIVPNKNRPGAANVYLNGVDICSWVPQFEVQDEHTPDYSYSFNDMVVPFRTRGEIKELVSIILEKLKDKDYAAAVFDTPLNEVEETYGDHNA